MQCENKWHTSLGITYRENDASSAINANPKNEWRVRIGDSGHFVIDSIKE